MLFTTFLNSNIHVDKLLLGPPDSFNYLNQSGCTTIEGVDDGKNFENLKRAFTILTISDQEQEAIFRILASLLHLGNVNFGKDSKRNDAAYISNVDRTDYLYSLI